MNYEANILVRNEATHVKKLKVANQGSTRRSFTLTELRKIFAQCDAEWRVMYVKLFLKAC